MLLNIALALFQKLLIHSTILGDHFSREFVNKVFRLQLVRETELSSSPSTWDIFTRHNNNPMGNHTRIFCRMYVYVAEIKKDYNAGLISILVLGFVRYEQGTCRRWFVTAAILVLAFVSGIVS